MMIKVCKNPKSNKRKSLKAKGKGKTNGKGKDKQVYIPKPKNLKPSAKEHLAKDDTCHHCKEVGHYKRNCPAFTVAELVLRREDKVGTASSSDSRNQGKGGIFLEEIQEEEDTTPSEITSNIPQEVEGFEPPQGEVIPIQMQSMMDNMVWVLVNLSPGCKTVRSKWLFKKKTDMDGIVHVYKARLVAKGYTQLYEVDYEETFSPVADISAIRILISIAAYYDYEIWQMDVKIAFLNGYLDEDIYMVQPEGFVDPNHPRKVCKLQRSIYGLKQASRSWYKRFDEEIKRFRFAQNLDEPCVYQKASESNVTFLILYVDDIIIMGNHIPSLQSVKDYLGKCFAMKDLGEAAFILGIKIYRDRSKRLIGLCQNAYMDKILEWTSLLDAHTEIACLMLGSMTPELHRQFELHYPYDMVQELRSMFEKQARVEKFDLIQSFHACKQEEGKSVADYVLKMKGYVEQLEHLGYMLPQDISVGLILNGLTKDFVGFVRNYNMHNMGKTIGEIHAMLIEYEKVYLKAETPQVKGKGKDKKDYIPKPKNPKPTAMERPAKDDACHHCKEVGHWKRNCPVYLAELQKKRSKLALLPVLRIERKLKQGALYLYVGNGVRAQVEAIGSFDLVLPNGLVICLDNCHYAPTITRAKRNLDSTYLWHCRLAHINKKRIKQLQQDGLLKSTDDESFDQCESCLSGKMTKKPFPHNDYSRYGYVYLLKHKHEVFETFKVFKNEVENQLGKTIKAIRSDRGGEYISQEFKDYLKANGIVQQLTPPYTPQHNGVSERRNRTLLDMVRSMMNLTTLPLSFWDYALESATRILNMVPTKKVDKTPYEMWYGKVPNLSYLKVWGCEALVKRDTPDKLEQRSVKCIFIGYPKETMGYYFYFPPENKIVVARYAEFFEKRLISQEISGRAVDLEEIQEEEDTTPSEITSNIPQEVEGFEPPQEEVIPIRRSERTHRAPNRLCLNVEVEEHSLGDLNEPTSYKAAMLDLEFYSDRKFARFIDPFLELKKHQEAGIKDLMRKSKAALLIANKPGVRMGAKHYHRSNLLKVHTDDNLAYPFTKSLPKGKFTQHAKSMDFVELLGSL
ncbi:retrotransposon protein, putative, ty1-copia subclass [Tanacetum coccineum]